MFASGYKAPAVAGHGNRIGLAATRLLLLLLLTVIL